MNLIEQMEALRIKPAEEHERANEMLDDCIAIVKEALASDQDKREIMYSLEGLTFSDWEDLYSNSDVRSIAKAALELLQQTYCLGVEV